MHVPYEDDQGSRMLDITGAKSVEVDVRSDGKVLWVNVDGKCALRVCRIDVLRLRDRRRRK